MQCKKAVAAILAGVSLLSFAACDTVGKDTDPNATTATTAQITTEMPTTQAVVTTAVNETTTVGSVGETTTVNEVSTTAEPVTSVPVTQAPATEATTVAPTGYSKEQILNILSNAVNQTKGYKGAITVDHEESFNIVEPIVNVGSSATAGSLATKAVNFVKDLILKPSQEVYSFNNGIATTSEKEQTQLLLPKDAAFSLTADGVANAVLTEENGYTHIQLTLSSEETHSLSEVPRYNASAIGYLNLDGKFSIIKISKLDIQYPGSTIDAYIRSDGYVQSVTYVINMKAYSEANGMGISGSAKFSGSQTESWKINW